MNLCNAGPGPGAMYLQCLLFALALLSGVSYYAAAHQHGVSDLQLQSGRGPQDEPEPAPSGPQPDWASTFKTKVHTTRFYLLHVKRARAL